MSLRSTFIESRWCEHHRTFRRIKLGTMTGLQSTNDSYGGYYVPLSGMLSPWTHLGMLRAKSPCASWLTLVLGLWKWFHGTVLLKLKTTFLGSGPQRYYQPERVTLTWASEDRLRWLRYSLLRNPSFCRANKDVCWKLLLLENMKKMLVNKYGDLRANTIDALNLQEVLGTNTSLFISQGK